MLYKFYPIIFSKGSTIKPKRNAFAIKEVATYTSMSAFATSSNNRIEGRKTIAEYSNTSIIPDIKKVVESSGAKKPTIAKPTMPKRVLKLIDAVNTAVKRKRRAPKIIPAVEPYNNATIKVAKISKSAPMLKTPLKYFLKYTETTPAKKSKIVRNKEKLKNTISNDITKGIQNFL